MQMWKLRFKISCMFLFFSDTYVEDKSWQLHKAMISGNPVYVDVSIKHYSYNMYIVNKWY